ncbi:MAG TPA: response regulator, partial [Nannocystis sp.]
MVGSNAGGEPVEILVVDDREANRLALRAVLDSPEYRLVEAASGSEALRLLLRREFALLLIDVVMPEMSGLELAALIRRRPQTESVPILFLTAEASALDRIHTAYELGAVDYLVKPLVPAMVRAKVSVFVELYRQRKRVERQAALLLESVRQKTELELLQLRLSAAHRFRNLADAIPHIIFTARADGTVDYFNQRWFEYTGISIADAGGTWIGAVHEDDAAAARAAWERARRDGCEAEFECRLRGSGGQARQFLGRIVPERGASGTIEGWFGTFTDIEEQRRLYERAVEAVRLRDDFLSIASHELRTPLA